MGRFCKYCCFLLRFLVYLLYWRVASWVGSGSIFVFCCLVCFLFFVVLVGAVTGRPWRHFCFLLFFVVLLFLLFWRVSSWIVSGRIFFFAVFVLICCFLLFGRESPWVVSGRMFVFVVFCSVLLFFVVLEGAVMDRFWKYVCCLLFYLFFFSFLIFVGW